MKVPRLTEAATTRSDLLRWSMAGVLALTAHAAAVAGYLLLHPSAPLASGAPVMLVELATIPSAPETESLDIPEEPPMEKAELEREPEQTKPPEEEAPPPQQSEVVLPTVVPPPKPAAKPKKPPAPRTVANARAPNRADVANAAAQIGVSSAEAQVAQASWNSILSAHLQRHKRYPDNTRAQGVVTVGFTVNRSGHVLSRRIVRSSGYPELDQEALALLQRAQPLPAFPPAMTQAQVDRTVPLQFSLR